MFSYHNHSNFSDGHSDPEEMIVSAYNHGIREFGFSDHFCIWYDEVSGISFGMKDLGKYFKVLETLRSCYAHKLKLKFGVELENIPPKLEKASDVLKNYPLDYIIGGTHFIEEWPLDYSKDMWTELGSEEIDRRIKKYWEAHYNMCKVGDIDIVAHFDLYNKWGALTDNDYTEYFVECVKVIKDRGLATEINTAKKSTDMYPFYPNEAFIKILGEYDIPVIISADAHYPVHVTRHFDKAKELFEKYNIKHTARFDKRKMIVEDVMFD